MEFGKIFISIAMLVFMFMLLSKVVYKFSSLPESAYFSSSIALGILDRTGIALTAAFGVMMLLLAKYGFLLSRWQTLQQGQLIRYFVCMCACLLTWFLCSYGYNFYLNEGHYFDRFLIIAFLLLLWWRPAFVFFFIVLSYAMLMQLKYPDLGGTILAHKLQILKVLILFAGAFVIHSISGYRKTSPFVFVTCCLVASAYWLPAYAKLTLGWFEDSELNHMITSAYAHGWLTIFRPETVVSFAQSIAWLDTPMRVVVLIVEAGCLLLMINRKYAIGLLVGVVIFHFSVYLFIGFLFWTWILLDLGLLLLLCHDRSKLSWPIFNRYYFLISIPLIGFCTYWAKPPALGWLDTRLSYTFQLEAVAVNGDTFILAPEYFAPYEDVFTMTIFDYLEQDHTILVSAYGVTKDHRKAEAIMNAKTAAAIFELERKENRIFYNADRASVFHDFVRQFVQNRNVHYNSALDFSTFSPPRQFWSFIGEHNKTNQQISHVIVRCVTTLYNDEHLKEIRNHEVMRVDIH